jgi:hypothetical protein
MTAPTVTAGYSDHTAKDDQQGRAVVHSISAVLQLQCCPAPTFSKVHGIYQKGRNHPREAELKFGDLTPEVQAARLLHCRCLGIVSIRRLAAEAGLPVERTELLMCRGLATLIARGYPAEELCETYRVTPEQLSRASMVPIFSGRFQPLVASR